MGTLTNTTADALAAAQASAEDAGHSLAAARASLDQAQAAAADVRRRISGGEHIDPAQLAATGSAVETATLYLAGAERRNADAVAELRRATARHYAPLLTERLRVVSPDALAAARAEAVASVAEKVSAVITRGTKPYRELLTTAAETHASALADAREAGLIPGQVDPFSPVIADGSTLLLNGQPVPVVNVDAEVSGVVAAALAEVSA